MQAKKVSLETSTVFVKFLFLPEEGDMAPLCFYLEYWGQSSVVLCTIHFNICLSFNNI